MPGMPPQPGPAAPTLLSPANCSTRMAPGGCASPESFRPRLAAASASSRARRANRFRCRPRLLAWGAPGSVAAAGSGPRPASGSDLQEHRYDTLARLDAAGDYPAERRVAGTPLLAAPGWQPAAACVPLQDIGLITARDSRHRRRRAPRGSSCSRTFATRRVRPAAQAAQDAPRPLLAPPSRPAARAPRRCCPSGRTGPAIFATRTRCGNWRPRRCSRTAPPPTHYQIPTYRLTEADPGGIPAGVHPRPLFRRRGHRRGGRARVRGHPARRPGQAGLRALVATRATCAAARRTWPSAR